MLLASVIGGRAGKRPARSVPDSSISGDTVPVPTPRDAPVASPDVGSARRIRHWLTHLSGLLPSPRDGPRLATAGYGVCDAEVMCSPCVQMLLLVPC